MIPSKIVFPSAMDRTKPLKTVAVCTDTLSRDSSYKITLFCSEIVAYFSLAMPYSAPPNVRIAAAIIHMRTSSAPPISST